MIEQDDIGLSSIETSLVLSGNGLNIYDQVTSFIREHLNVNEHYGIVPGTSKPSLYKAGAQLLAKEGNIDVRYEIIDRTVDHENNIYASTFKATAYRNDIQIAEGYGACSSRERKYLGDKIDKGFLYNNILKMAKKRAFVDVIIESWGISGIFTQDLEDLKGDGNRKQKMKVDVYEDHIESKPFNADDFIAESIPHIKGIDNVAHLENWYRKNETVIQSLAKDKYDAVILALKSQKEIINANSNSKQ